MEDLEPNYIDISRFEIICAGNKVSFDRGLGHPSTDLTPILPSRLLGPCINSLYRISTLEPLTPPVLSASSTPQQAIVRYPPPLLSP